MNKAVHPILVTGGTGQVGSAFVRQAALNGVTTFAPQRSQLNLLGTDTIADFVRASKWSAIVNCAAYTAVDRAESEPELAHAINAVAPGILAQEAANANIPIIHISTDYVFDGSKNGYYLESDIVNPMSVYGRTKEAGERAVRDANSSHAIIRTAWVVSAEGNNFINTMLRLAREKNEVRIVDDQTGSPSSANDIAEALLAVTRQLEGRKDTWHFTNSGEASWYDLAVHIFASVQKHGKPVPQVIPISSAEYPTAAKRPTNSRLATQKFVADFELKPRPWQAAVTEILAQRLGS